jgi:hypothetical protein
MERGTVRNAAGPRIQDLVAGPPRKGRDGDHQATRISSGMRTAPLCISRRLQWRHRNPARRAGERGFSLPPAQPVVCSFAHCFSAISGGDCQPLDDQPTVTR